ncbi:sporulation protein YpjB [Ornithinibacillus xuwenensis]|uniref:Sporulation protein YpjB n=1 Tax=Ornithinibacillus xuwenensis TaxID=3144668 RepID=A0ABU9XD45_9BACI
MKRNKLVNIFKWLLIGILLYVLIEIIIGETVNANTKQNQKGDDNMFPFYWLIIIVGGIIAITLSYVSWRKYRGEKEEKKNLDTE